MLKMLILATSFLTGATGLAYQTYWQKYLSYLVGSESRSISLIVGVFLLGLAAGYEFWGRVTQKYIKKNELLRTYSYIEFAIGMYVILFPSYFTLLEKIVFSTPRNFLIDLVVTIFALLIPTFLMGGTIPILTAYLPNNIKEVNDSHIKVYGINTIGAFFGVFLGLFLIGSVGLKNSIILTGLFNIIIGIFYFFAKDNRDIHFNESIPVVENKLSSKFIYAFVGITGCVSLTFEVLSVRSLGLAIGMNIYVFPMILSIFILGLGYGPISLLKKNYTIRDIVFEIQKLLFFFVLAYISIPYWPTIFSNYRVMFSDSIGSFWMYYFLVYLTMCLILLPSILSFGRMIPMAYSLINRSGDEVGVICGRVYFFNTLGTIVGAFLFGHLFLYFLNLEGIFILSILLLLCCLTFVLVKQNYNQLAHLPTVFILCLIILIPLGRESHWVGLFRTRVQTGKHFKVQKITSNYKKENILFFEDGPNTTVTVVSNKESRSIVTNGKSDGSTGNLNDYATMSLAAIYPYVFNENNEKLNAAVIGQGLGITSGLLGALDDVSLVDQIEISPMVIKTGKYFSKSNFDMINNKKIKTHETDAFRFFSSKKNYKYDIISAEPSNPWVVGVENLYTPKFYKLVSNNLNEKGIYIQWIHTYSMDPSIIKTIINNLYTQFNYIQLYSGGANDLLFVSSKSKISFKINEKRFKEDPITTALQRSNIPQELSVLQFLKIMDNKKTQMIVGTGSVINHTLNHPVISIMANRAFFYGKKVDIMSMVDSNVSRELNNLNSMELAKLYKNNQELFKKYCVKNKKAVLNGIFCIKYVSIFNTINKLEEKNIASKIMAYKVLRELNILKRDKKFLLKAKDLILETNSTKEMISIFDELKNEQMYEEAFEYIKILKEKKLLGPKNFFKLSKSLDEAKQSIELVRTL